MRLKPEAQTNFIVELTKNEIQFIRDITQNSFYDSDNEPANESKARLSLFVGASRILGYDMNDDGSINKGSK